MKLFLISQSENNGYDTFDSAVVAAKSEEDARTIQPGWTERGWDDPYSSWCASPEKVAVKLIGTTTKGTPRGVILASFNAG